MNFELTKTPEEIREHFFDLRDRGDVADLLEISDSDLVYYLYILPEKVGSSYTLLHIPKKSGKFREISIPILGLKIIQKKLNQVFKTLYRPKPSTHGFVVGKSILTNASNHLNQKFVLNIDIEDFFPSINFGRVRGMLMAKPYSCNEKVATILAQICTHKNQLPQGAPTSPIVSNMLCAALDSKLQQLAKKYMCLCTRYGDDITFSTSRPKFPRQIGYFSDEEERFVIGRELAGLITKNGFKLNHLKTRIGTRSRRQEVTGVLVNEKLNVRRSYIRQIRAMLHAWKKFGLKKAEEEFSRKYHKNQKYHRKQPSFKYVVRGKIDFVGRVRGKQDHI